MTNEPEFTEQERELIGIAQRRNVRLAGWRRRYRGHTLTFISGAVGDIRTFTCARHALHRFVAGLLINRREASAKRILRRLEKFALRSE